jgi:hypothetical protein
MSTDAHTPIEGWAIVELFGHNKIAGYVTTAIIGTSAMLRIDIPEVEEAPAYTRFYGPGAIYSLTLVTEEIARAALKAIRPAAVTVYIPRQIAPSAGYGSYYDADDGDEDDEDNHEDNGEIG